MKFNHISAILASAPLLARAATAGDLTVLTMNVAGLPAILNNNDVPGDKATNAASIGSLFSKYGYDIVHAQEDFNYHASLYSTDNHLYRTATSGGVPFGDGLNTLSDYSWIDFERVKWATCSDASSNDCLTPKGFTFMRIALSNSASTAVYVDFYNLHADAGTEPGDLTARTANLRQVAAAIASRSVGNAVLVFGDTNSRYSRTGDVGVRELLATAGPGLTDAWVQLERGGTVPTAESLCSNPSTSDYCETVDKVFYRSSPLVSLAATDFRYVSDKFLQADGNILSDHNPILVNLTWSTSQSKLQQSRFMGGPHGTWFSDVPTLAAKAKTNVTAITLRGGSRLDAISATLKDRTVLSHGGQGGTASSLTLADGEYWTAATVCQGQKSGRTRIFHLSATTSLGRTLASGTATSDCGDFAAPAGWQIVGFLGRDGDEIDQLAFVYGPR
ncbi:endonuclease/Exonuclease/phosphatase [Coniochaeta sp. 2T2.1]|nr:endonuclease/Exonuclease/phosphatase [Coniochaeta sp. 2T2.1]